MFVAFKRLENSRSAETGGSGLGLAIARSAVRAHGGEARLLNQADDGLGAEVTLPVPREGGSALAGPGNGILRGA